VSALKVKVSGRDGNIALNGKGALGQIKGWEGWCLYLKNVEFGNKGRGISGGRGEKKKKFGWARELMGLD